MTIPTHSLLEKLEKKAQKGSKPRCHLLTNGSPEDVARKLTSLIDPWGEVRPDHSWMPCGFDQIEEAQLGKAQHLLTDTQKKDLMTWWLAIPSPRANTPNWDIASECLIGGRPGLLLLEAKAHDMELHRERSRKRLSPSASDNSVKNHKGIAACIESANVALTHETGLKWSLSRDHHYQMSNRFAWSWKLAEIGVPVILVYLAFLDAAEMGTNGQTPLASDDQWARLVTGHSEPLFPSTVWNHSWTLHGQPFIPLIRSATVPLNSCS